VGILVTFSPEFAKEAGLADGAVGAAIATTYLGLAIGDLASGFVSQALRQPQKGGTTGPSLLPLGLSSSAPTSVPL